MSPWTRIAAAFGPASERSLLCEELFGNFRARNVHDFEDMELGKVVRYGVYDVTANCESSLEISRRRAITNSSLTPDASAADSKCYRRRESAAREFST
jgi:hypothetical protein